jgi:hypothetical protein
VSASSPSIQGGQAAKEVYRYLRAAKISHNIAFRAAVERFKFVCPEFTPAEAEAAAWDSVRREM